MLLRHRRVHTSDNNACTVRPLTQPGQCGYAEHDAGAGISQRFEIDGKRAFRVTQSMYVNTYIRMYEVMLVTSMKFEVCFDQDDVSLGPLTTEHLTITTASQHNVDGGAVFDSISKQSHTFLYAHAVRRPSIPIHGSAFEAASFLSTRARDRTMLPAPSFHPVSLLLLSYDRSAPSHSDALTRLLPPDPLIALISLAKVSGLAPTGLRSTDVEILPYCYTQQLLRYSFDAASSLRHL